MTDNTRRRLGLGLLWMSAVVGVAENAVINVRHLGWWAGCASVFGYIAVAMLTMSATVDDYDRREHVLELLANGAWWGAIELVEASDGFISRARIYGALRRLEDDGLVVSIDDPHTGPEQLKARGGLPRRVYRRSATRRAP